MRNNDIKAFLSNFSQIFNQFLVQTISPYIRRQTVTEVTEPLIYSLNAGGKRLRPALFFLCAGKSPQTKADRDEQQRLLYLATAVEVMHTYSLIHDDLPAMDNDTMRRGQPSCHVRFSEWAAILAGDALNTFSFELLAKAAPERHLRRMVTILSTAAGMQGMVAGQALDLAAEREKSLQEEDSYMQKIERIHRYKTSALFQAVCQLGACEAGIENLEPYSNYGNRLGLLYQLQDDLLDIHNDGGTVFSEAAEKKKTRNKPTYPQLYGLENGLKKSIRKTEILQAELQEIAMKLPLSPTTEDHRPLLRDLPEYLARRKS